MKLRLNHFFQRVRHTLALARRAEIIDHPAAIALHQREGDGARLAHIGEAGFNHGAVIPAFDFLHRHILDVKILPIDEEIEIRAANLLCVLAGFLQRIDQLADAAGVERLVERIRQLCIRVCAAFS